MRMKRRFILVSSSEGIKRGYVMSSFVKRAMVAAACWAGLVAGTAGAQLLPSVSVPALPPINLPSTGNVPVAGPVLGNILSQPQAREVVAPTLNTVSGLPQSVIDAGPSTLLELRSLRLKELIRQNPRELESDGDGLPIRRGVIVTIDPDPASLSLAARAGFRIIDDRREDALAMRTVTLAVPNGLRARDGLKRLHKAAPALQADFDHVFEPAGGELLPFAGALAGSTGGGGVLIGIVDGGVASHASLARAAVEQTAGLDLPTIGL